MTPSPKKIKRHPRLSSSPKHHPLAMRDSQNLLSSLRPRRSQRKHPGDHEWDDLPPSTSGVRMIPFINMASDKRVVCEEHKHFKPVTTAYFHSLCGPTLDSISTLSLVVQQTAPHLLDGWADGCFELKRIGDNEIQPWKREDCCICEIIEMIYGSMQLPLLTGLLLIGKKRDYARCLRGLKYIGEDVLEIDKYVRSLVAAK